ncbi:MAG: ABC transporter ATP-binding protein [Pseudorhodoplanes sp.]|nr:ABC transporter ATP-binding protein [Pseudorhodoplanes sp.]MCL4712493.1 ABC transporter ATP-binding protein [Pseudorhodoplanes sp.]MCQ3943307.1 ABC transporter ATP-binding protein [Alphaproteobacteria bacterium]
MPAGGRTPAAIAARVTYENVTHRYGDIVAVSDLSLDIAPGEIMCLLGRSGCGKTTLLRLAAGVEEPAEGRILISEREVAARGHFVPPEQRGVGLMFQDFALFPHLTNLENVMFGLRALPRAEAAREAARALARVGLDHLSGAYPHMLSGGEQQRVALARAVAPRPSVLLMDEPFSGLDRRLRDEVREDTLKVLRESRVTGVIVTHDPDEALAMADRIALMRAGRLVQVDAPEAMYRRPADLEAARFFCELNEIPGIVRGGMAETAVGRFAAPGLAEGAAAVVAIRPQAIRIDPPGTGLAARLQRRQFAGPVDLLEIAVESLERPLKARILRAAIADIKADLGIAFDPAEVLVFAATGA